MNEQETIRACLTYVAPLKLSFLTWWARVDMAFRRLADDQKAFTVWGKVRHIYDRFRCPDPNKAALEVFKARQPV